jgi:hypothetical protein
MRVYPCITQQNSFAPDFTNLAWGDTVPTMTKSPIPTTMSVTDITFPSLDDVDMLEPDLLLETTFTNANTSPKILESISLMDTDLDRVYPYVTKQNSFAQDFTNLAWEGTVIPITKSPIPCTMSVTDITLFSLSLDDIDTLEPDHSFVSTLSINILSPKTLESSD